MQMHSSHCSPAIQAVAQHHKGMRALAHGQCMSLGRGLCRGMGIGCQVRLGYPGGLGICMCWVFGPWHGPGGRGLVLLPGAWEAS
eukprot:9178285-Alexandrium_andersonii.AAC.1